MITIFYILHIVCRAYKMEEWKWEQTVILNQKNVLSVPLSSEIRSRVQYGGISHFHNGRYFLVGFLLLRSSQSMFG